MPVMDDGKTSDGHISTVMHWSGIHWNFRQESWMHQEEPGIECASQRTGRRDRLQVRRSIEWLMRCLRTTVAFCDEKVEIFTCTGI